ncbi:hypothetical protein A6769_03290 [Nostoc punctiforme NIES-2108]|uniref:Uncharacterized protein n=1 Tax=Nostoc punctiforme NIES-2108 TaxID=1356359 RepID=A0A367RWP7_NOSPU|nr:hypothetical protein A6769_03290 [Nostoc punctiforme NIES-2108]
MTLKMSNLCKFPDTELILLRSSQYHRWRLYNKKVVCVTDYLQLFQVSYILKVLEMKDVNFRRLSEKDSPLKEVFCEIQQSVLKKVTNH